MDRRGGEPREGDRNWVWCLVFDWEESLFLSVHVIIATPGRILDLMNKNLVKIGKCGMLVLDEVSLNCLAILFLFVNQIWQIIFVNLEMIPNRFLFRFYYSRCVIVHKERQSELKYFLERFFKNTYISLQSTWFHILYHMQKVQVKEQLVARL